MVWRATQEGTLREVALKFLAPWHAHGLAGLRFAREAEIAASLEHENIVRVYGSGESVSGPWLAMELVEGPTADRWIAENDPPLRARVELFRGICAGVRHAHQRGVIHRDLKPSNVLVAPDGTPKVADFGLAARQEAESLDVTLTRQGEVFGSLAWMAPEQAEGRWKEVDALSDVYALGAVLYSLGSGRSAVDTSLPAAVQLAAVKAGEHRPLREVQPGTPRDLEAITEKCMAREKVRRYQTVAELEVDVARWLRGDPVQARTAAPLYWIGKKLRRHWVAAAAAVTVLFAAGGLTWGYWQGRARLESEKRAALKREAEQKSRTLHEARELVTQLLVEMKPKFEQSGHPEWIAEAEKRVAAFPWDIGGDGTGAWDPRRFRGRAALVQGDLLSSQAQWGGALNAYKEAISHLKALVPEHPDVPAFREDLARARVGEAVALLKLRYHTEAVNAAQMALDLLEPGNGDSAPDAVWAAMTDAGCVLAQAASAADGKAEGALRLLIRLTEKLPGEKEPEKMTAAQAEWHSRLCSEASRLTMLVKQVDGGIPANSSVPDAAVQQDLLARKVHLSAVLARRAVACARQAVKLSGEGELSLRQLAAALAAEAETATLCEDPSTAYERLKEANTILLKRLGSPPLNQSAGPYEVVAQAWDHCARTVERIGQGANYPTFNAWAIELNSAAIEVQEALRRRNKTTASIEALSRHCLRNALLSFKTGKPSDAARWAASTVRKFEIAVTEKICSIPLAQNAAEAALLLVDWREPNRSGRGETTWLECASRAIQWTVKQKKLLQAEDSRRQAELEKRLQAAQGFPDSSQETSIARETESP